MGPSRVENFELDLESLGWIDIRRRNTQQVDSQSMRIALAGSAISDAAASVAAPSATHTVFAIWLGCGRIPKFRAGTNGRDVDVLHFLSREETRPSEQFTFRGAFAS